MSKTKEQIMQDEYKKLVMNWEKAYQQSPSIFKAAHSAMDEYAKQQAMLFRHFDPPLGSYTTEEIYNLFLQSQSQ